MNKPIKCGDMWIKFDQNNIPEYGFIVEGKNIQKFVPLSSKKPHQVILPDICEYHVPSAKDLDLTIDGSDSLMPKSYLNGEIALSSGCFDKSNQPDEIVLPFHHSLEIEKGAIDMDTELKLIVKNGMDIFSIQYSTFPDSSATSCFMNWVVVGRKEIKNLSTVNTDGIYTVSAIDKQFFPIVIDRYMKPKAQEDSDEFGPRA